MAQVARRPQHLQVFHTSCDCRIHPPDVIGKYAPDSVIGAVGSGVAAAAPSAAPKASGPIRHHGSIFERSTVS